MNLNKLPNTSREQIVANTTGYISTTEKGVSADYNADPYLNPPETVENMDIRTKLRRAAAATTRLLSRRTARTQQGTD